MPKFTEFVNVYISGARQIVVTNAKISDTMLVTDKDIVQNALDTLCMKLLVVKMSFDQNMVNAKTCSMKLTHVCWLSMQQMSMCQMCVANWVMTPPPMRMKEDFILDTTESMEVTGGNPVFIVKPQL
jgi:hypothetical protein